MKCDECRNQFSAYFESALSQALKDRVVDHLEACSACREEWEGFESLMAELGALAPIHAPEGLEFNVLRRLRRLSSAGSGERWGQRRVLRYCLGSALCTFLVCLFVFRPFSSPENGEFATLDPAQVETLKTDGFLLLPDQGKAGENYVLIKMDEQNQPLDDATMPRQGGNSLYQKLGLHDSIYLGGDEEMEIYYLPEFRNEEKRDSRNSGRPELIPVASKIAF